MTIIWWIVVGLIAGALAKFIMPGKDPGGLLVTIILGILGAFVGGWVGGFTGITFGGGNLGAIIWATIGALILLAVYRMIKK